MTERREPITVRQEKPEDFQVITSVVKEAFAHAEHRDGQEHNLVGALREGEGYVPELSLIAEIKGKIVGHIMFTRAEVGKHTVLALAPLSVLPEYQRRGVGTALIKEGHRIARESGYGYSVVLGSENYYPRMGYLPAEKFGIRPPFPAPGDYFMACRLREDAPTVRGTMRYAKEFGLDQIQTEDEDFQEEAL